MSQEYTKRSEFVEGIFSGVLLHPFLIVMGIILTFNGKYVFIFLIDAPCVPNISNLNLMEMRIPVCTCSLHLNYIIS